MTLTRSVIGKSPFKPIADFRTFLSAGAPRTKPLKEDRSILDMTHTPTPWRFEKHGRNSDYFGNIVGVYGVTDHGSEKIRTISCQLKYGPEEESLANAELIVTAVNAFEANQARIAELEKALANASNALTYCLNGMADDPLKPKVAVTLKSSLAALSAQP